MQRAARSGFAVLVLLLASSASAGVITSTINGRRNADTGGGELLTVDVVITFGPTAISGFGSGLEVSFDATSTGGGARGGTTVTPDGWVDLTGGTFSCDGSGFCDNIAAAANFGAPGFAPGATFALASVMIDTTGLAPGVYAVGAVLGDVGPDGILGAGGVDLTSQYSSILATISVICVPEPGSAALLGLGLALLGLGRRR